MTSTAMLHQSSPPEQDDFGLNEIARHNAQQAQPSTEEFPAYQEDAKGLGIYQDGYHPVYMEDQSYVHNPPTPRSNTASEGVRTRSGRSNRRTDSPFSTSKSRVSGSPAPRKKNKKSKLDKSKTPKLTAPLSILTKDMEVPMKDIEAHVNRSKEQRLKELEQSNGYVKRPMNSFMLYRSAFADRTKHWCKQNNHQVVSSVAGESWPLESDELRSQFDQWAKTERQHHQEAHPNYKFSPSKSSNKRRKGDVSDDEIEPSDLDEHDPDGEYRGGRSVRQRRQPRETVYLPTNVGFESHPYYGQQLNGYEPSQFQYANPGRPLPSNIAYDMHGNPYDTHMQTYLHQSPPQQHTNPYMYHDMQNGTRVSTPASLNGQQTIGGYGLPGGQIADDIFSHSRTSTPMQHYNPYGQQMYAQYQGHYQSDPYHPISTSATPQPGSQQYEHAQYLTQAQEAIDPALQAALDAAAAADTADMGHDSHFDDALGDMAASDMGDMPPPEYYGQGSTSPVDVNATLAPAWNPTSEFN